MSKEEWKDVVGYEDLYEVSNLGNIKSKRRNIILKTGITKGYKGVVLCDNKKRLTISVHIVVANAFLNHKQCGMKQVIDHIDGDTLNNNVTNLQILSHRDNIRKANREQKSSKFTGVTWHKKRELWRSYINFNKKQIHLGFYENQEKAKLAYDTKLKELISLGYD